MDAQPGQDIAGFPPVQLQAAVCLDVEVPEVGAVRQRDEKQRMVTLGQALQRGEVHVVVMVVTEQNRVDARQLLEGHARREVPLGAEVPEGAERSDQIGSVRRFNPRVWDEHGRMIDEGDDHGVALHARRRRRRLDRRKIHDPVLAGLARDPPAQEFEESLVRSGGRCETMAPMHCNRLHFMLAESMEASSMAAEPTNIAEQQQIARMRRLFDSQRAAFMAAPMPQPRGRRADLKRLKEVLIANRERFVAAISADFGGRAGPETMAEILAVVHHINYCLRRLKRWMKPQRRGTSLLMATTKAMVYFQPLGVVGIIAPWNYTIALSAGRWCSRWRPATAS
jgi:hypothetical protein